MKKYTVLIVFGLVATGAGLGAGIAAAVMMMGKRPAATIATEISTTNSANPLTVQPFCQFDALSGVTSSLNNVRQINQLTRDPIPSLVNFTNTITPDLIARFNPVPWPNISDRARAARVPVVMYHDITAVKQVSYDVTPEELAQHFQAIQDAGLTPITMDQLVAHLRTGISLPEKPILLTFDDNYLGQYQYAFPLLKQYNYPAVFAVHTGFVGKPTGRDHSTWDQLREMQNSGLVTVISHTVNHPNLSRIDDSKIRQELTLSKQVLEKELGVPIRYFAYPEGSYSSRIKQFVADAGYEAALTMSLIPSEELPAGQSEDLLAIRRYGQSRLMEVIPDAWGGPQSSPSSNTASNSGSGPVTFSTPVEKKSVNVDGFPITLIYGGKPVTIHADTRGQVAEIMKMTDAIAAVDGAFFSLESLYSNKMIGPVLSQYSSKAGVLDVGRKGENPLLKNRPLVLISPNDVRFVPYDPDKHSTKEQLEAELPGVTDAFVGAAWLVRDGKPQTAEKFGKLYGFDASRDRAFWGIDRSGRPVIGVTMEMIDSVNLGKLLAKAGLQDVVMLDSGASAALAYKGKSLMSYEPRPVPHVVALMPPVPASATATPNGISCPVSYNNTSSPSSNSDSSSTSSSGN